MKDGIYTFYSVQALCTAQTPYGFPNTKSFYKTENANWNTCDFVELDPWSEVYGKKQFIDQSDDKYLCWAKTGYIGWFNLCYVKEAIKRVRRKRYFYYEDGYGKVQYITKYRFRIIKRCITLSTEILKT